MTENEAIKILRGAIKKPNTKDGYLGQAVTMSIQALEEIQQYREIGLTPTMVRDLIKSCGGMELERT